MAANSLSAAWRSWTISWGDDLGRQETVRVVQGRVLHPGDVEVDLVAGFQFIVGEHLETAVRGFGRYPLGAGAVGAVRLELCGPSSHSAGVRPSPLFTFSVPKRRVRPKPGARISGPGPRAPGPGRVGSLFRVYVGDVAPEA